MLMVYTIAAIAGTVVLVLLFALSMLGVDDGTGAHEVSGFHTMEGITVDGDATHAFSVLSLRSLVAAIAFFGLGGRFGEAAGLAPYLTFVVAVGLGTVAMVTVAWIMHMLMNLREDGTVRVEGVVGLPARCYLNVPGQRSGRGKITVTIQNRTMEFDAVTQEDAIPTGAEVVVVGIVDPHTVEVTPGTG